MNTIMYKDTDWDKTGKPIDKLMHKNGRCS